jgi:hypothetical protein
MRIISTLIISLIIFLFYHPGTKAIELESQITKSKDPAWTVKIVKTTQPKEVNVVGGAIYNNDGTPPENQKWVQIKVKLTPPKAGESISVKGINLIDDSSKSYPLLALDKVEKNPGFNFLVDIGRGGSVGFGLMDDNNNIIVFVVKGNEGDISLSFQGIKPVDLFLLFAVPLKAKNLRLQVDVEPQVSIPIKIK